MISPFILHDFREKYNYYFVKPQKGQNPGVILGGFQQKCRNFPVLPCFLQPVGQDFPGFPFIFAK